MLNIRCKLTVLTAIQHQMDSTSGSWTTCTADDGAIDEKSEGFTCSITVALSDGTHTLYVRATDNASNTSSSASDTFTIDSTAPLSFDQDSPADGSYINSGRPSFKWKAASTTDATSGLSKYKLEVYAVRDTATLTLESTTDFNTRNGSSGFAVDDISVSRTTVYETSQYKITYTNFEDTDSTNNYISVETKSSSSWSTAANDGKLKQGKYAWKVTAYDNAGNTLVSSKDFKVDLTSPSLTSSAVSSADNLGEVEEYFVISNLKPTITGTLTDNFSVSKVDFSFYKQNFFLGIETGRTLYTLETLNYSQTNTLTSPVTTWSFSFSPSQHLAYGKYLLTIKGYDKAGNTSEQTLNLQILTDEKAKLLLLLEEKDKEKKEGKLEELREKQQVSLPELEKKAVLRRHEEARQLKKLTDRLADLASGFSRSLAKLFRQTGRVLAQAGQAVNQQLIAFQAHWSNIRPAKIALKINLPQVNLPKINLPAIKTPTVSLPTITLPKLPKLPMAQIVSPIVKTSNFLTTSLADSQANIKDQISQTHRAASEGMRKSVEAFKLAVRSVEQPAVKTANFVYRVKVAFLTAHSILFDPNPTKIEAVYVEGIGKDYAVISWETNHYTKNNKVNYGESLKYGQSLWAEDYAKQHLLRIANLKPNTRYFFEVMSQNKNYVYDAYYSFETLEP